MCVRQDLSTTSYALLGLLAFDGTSSSLTGYELKQRADRTLRFYWVSPAMSQVCSDEAVTWPSRASRSSSE